MKRKYDEILVIPDSHASPDVPNDRFTAAGEFTIERQPDYIIDIGDSADMASLSEYDRGSIYSEGRRYVDDINAYHDAMRRFLKPIEKYNNTHTRWKKKKYLPKMYKRRGNHEERIVRGAAAEPRLYGHLSYADLREEEFGWETFDLHDKPTIVHDIAFSHYFTSGVMGRPISGEHHAAQLVKKKYMSCVAGHSHMRSFWETDDAAGRKRFGLVVGCYMDLSKPLHWVNVDTWWSGLVYLHDVREGQAEPEFLAYHTYLKDKYL